MSTVKATYIQHPSASSPNFTLAADGSTAAAGLTGSGLDLITSESFSAVPSVSVNNCFSATYQNYKIVINAILASGGADGFIRLRASGSDNSTASSYVRQRLTAAAGVVAGTRDTDNTWGVWQLNSTAQNGIILEMFNPFASTTTAVQTTVASSDSSSYLAHYVGTHNQSTSYDGFTIYNIVANMSGTIRVYGYKD